MILLISLYAISQFDPVAQLGTVAKLATFIAFVSATQDIVLDAYRREILTDNELGLGNTIHINAYRIAGLIPGGCRFIWRRFIRGKPSFYGPHFVC